MSEKKNKVKGRKISKMKNRRGTKVSKGRTKMQAITTSNFAGNYRWGR